MEKYIILIDCEQQCIDLHCEFTYVDSLYKVEITNPFESSVIITQDCENKTYTEAAKYILDKGKVISIIPLIEKRAVNFFRVYIRIEEINRRLSKFKTDQH